MGLQLMSLSLWPVVNVDLSQATFPCRGQGDFQREGLSVSVLCRAHVSGPKGHSGFQQ